MPPLAPKHRLPWDKPKTAARERERKAKVDERRKDDPIRALYWQPEWKRESKAFLALPENRYCFCGCGRRSNMVHHKRGPRSAKSFEEAKQLFWEKANWRPAHRNCNSRRSVGRASAAPPTR